MSKKVLKLTESQLKKVIEMVINEENPLNRVTGQVSGSSHKSVQAKFAGCRSVPPAGRGLEYVAKMIYDAITGLGTDEQKIYNAFRLLKSYNSLCGLLGVYKKTYGTDLFSDLDKDIDNESEWSTISQIIAPLKVMAQQPQQTTGGVKPQQTTGGAKTTAQPRPQTTGVRPR